MHGVRWITVRMIHHSTQCQYYYHHVPHHLDLSPITASHRGAMASQVTGHVVGTFAQRRWTLVKRYHNVSCRVGAV